MPIKAQSHARGAGKKLWAALSAALGVCASPALGDSHSWVGLHAYPWWDFVENWSPAAQPANGDTARVYWNSATDYTVWYWNALYPSALLGSVTLDQTGGGKVTLSMDYNYNLASSWEYIGFRSNGRGALAQSTGTNTINAYLYLGFASTSFGSYNLSGGTLRVNPGAYEYVGYEGIGTSYQFGGQHIVGAAGGTNSHLYVGWSNTSTGSSYALSNGTLQVYGDEIVGVNGQAAFLQTGGVHQIKLQSGLDALRLGSGAVGSGIYSLVNGSLTIDGGNEYVGYYGIGTFNQSGGSHVVGDSIPQTLFIGYLAGSSGHYRLGGGTLSPYLGTGVTEVGRSGTGVFDQSAGTLSALMLHVASSGTGVGTYILSGGSAQAQYSQIIGFYGSGSFLQSNGTNTTHDYLTIGDEASGRGFYRLSAGTLAILNSGHDGHLYVGNYGLGTLQQLGGLATINSSGTNASLFLGHTPGGVGTYLLQGGTLSTSGRQSVGYASTTASRFIQSGGVNKAAGLRIGELPGSVGIYQLSGSGSLTVSENLTVGYSGTGSFAQNGGNVSIEYPNSLVLGSGAAGAASGHYALSNGNLSVGAETAIGAQGIGAFVQTGGTHTNLTLTILRGSYSMSNNSSSLSSMYYQRIGGLFGARFDQSGGTNSTHDYLSIAPTTDTVGTYSLSGGTLSVVGGLHDGAVYVGHTGSGTFIQSGGLHTITSYGGTLPGSMAVGYASTSFGRYDISGGTLSTNSAIYVGMAGTGTFIQSGGLVNVGTSMVALGSYDPSTTRGTGTYLMSDGTLISGSLIVGDPGFGTFIQTGGHVSASTLKIANYRLNPMFPSTGYYRIDNGTLQTNQMIVGYEGGAKFEQNGGSVEVTDYMVMGNRPAAPWELYTLNAGSLHSGYEYVGFMSGGSFTQTGGTHIVDQFLTLGPYAIGDYALQGGTLSAGSIQVAMGTFTQTGGTLAVASRFVNSSHATVGGVQRWAPGSMFINNATSSLASFNTDAGSASARPLSIWLQGGSLTSNSSQHLASLILYDGSHARLSANGNRVLSTGSLQIEAGPEPLATLDLADNDMIWDYGLLSPLPTVATFIAHAHHGGAWDQKGITSSLADNTRYALGYGDNDVLHYSSFAGESVDHSSVLVKFTYYGDADLNGKVDINDLGMLASHWQVAGPWTSGDFDYSGVVNVADLGLLASNWQRGVGAPLAGSLGEALAQLGLPPAAVPEPMVFGYALALLSLIRHRDKSRTRLIPI
jgi:hypothetical protein